MVKKPSTTEHKNDLQMDMEDIKFELESIIKDRESLEPEKWNRAMNIVRWRKLRELKQREQYANDQKEQLLTLIKQLENEGE